MYRIYLILIALFSIIFMMSIVTKPHECVAGKAKGEQPGAGIFFYNVENLYDTIDDPLTDDAEFLPKGKLEWDGKRFTKKLERLSEVFKVVPFQPMLIGMAEIENEAVLKSFLTQPGFSEKEYGIVHQDSPDVRGIDCGLIYSKKDFYLLEERFITVKIDSIPDFKTRDILYAKGKLTNKEVLHVFVNHWPSRRGGEETSSFKRNYVASLLRQEVNKIFASDPQANIVIMGDLNDYPTNESVREVLGASPLNTPSRELFNLMTEYHGTQSGTYNYKGEWGVLDHLIVSKGLVSGKNKTKIHNKKSYILSKPEMLVPLKEEGKFKPFATYAGPKYLGGFSDHLPVFTVVIY